jgi:DNA-directed RNA polymerase specialized sigma24 family protein
MQGDGARGEAAVPPARDLQPSPEALRLGLGAPVDESQDGLDAKQARQARRLRESIERRTADRALLQNLASGGFAGRHYDEFVTELVRYAVSVLRAWMYSGYIFKLLDKRGFGLHPDDVELEALHHDIDLRQDLAMMTVALALPRFRQQALIEGGWTFEGGASITTYFMGACAYNFPNEFRRWRTSNSRQDRAIAKQRNLSIETAHPSVESTVLGNERVIDHLAAIKDDKTKQALLRTMDGYTQEEIAELLDEASARAIEGLMYRWRQKAKQKEEDERHG